MSNDTTITCPNTRTTKNAFFYVHWKHLWIIVFLGSVNIVLRDAASINETPLTYAVIHRPITAILVGTILLLPLIKWPRRLLRGILGSLMLFSLWRLITSIWSEFPLWTIYRSIEYLIIVILASYTVASLKNLTDLTRWLNLIWWWIGILVVSAYLGIIFFPEDALKSVPDALLPVMLHGVLPRINPNGLAQMGGILALVGISRWYGKSKEKKWLFVILLGIATMILSQGRAAMAGFLIVYFFIILLHRRFSVVLLFTLLSFSILISGAWEFFWEFYQRGQSTELFLSLSTRYDWWKSIWNHIIIDNFLLGHGAFAGGRILSPIETGEFTRITVDNAWLELITDTGIIGALLFLFPIIRAFKILLTKSITNNSDVKAVSIESLAILSLILIRSFFVSSITLHNAFFLFASLGCAEFLRTQRA